MADQRASWQAGYDAAMQDAAKFLRVKMDQPTLADELLRYTYGGLFPRRTNGGAKHG